LRANLGATTALGGVVSPSVPELAKPGLQLHGAPVQWWLLLDPPEVNKIESSQEAP
jgi:hypothetical protein